MTKPTIFFSHSSKDESTLGKLKQALHRKVGGAVEIFMSSDGQSIRLGKNWVSSLEEALGSTGLMFVFLSPRSVQSNWIYFEAGFSYSRDIRVIPVGIHGLNLETIPPPMGLLQGFNLDSGPRLNNFLAEINHTYNHDHELTFTQRDYEDIFQLRAAGRVVRAVPIYMQWVDTILIRTRLPFRQAKPHVVEVYRAHQIDFQASEDKIISYGVTYRHTWRHPDDSNWQNEVMLIDVNPSEARAHLDLLREITERTNPEKASTLSVTLYFVPQVGCLRAHHHRTARLRGAGIKLGADSDLVFEDVSFYLESGSSFGSDLDTDYPTDLVTLSLSLSPDRLASFEFQKLLHALFRSGILFFSEG